MIYKIPEYGIIVETRVNEKGNKVTTLNSERSVLPERGRQYRR